MQHNQPDPNLSNDPFSQGSNSNDRYQEPQEMSMMEAVKVCFDKYAEFDGRSRRSEFWYFRLFQLIVIFGLLILAGIGSLIHDVVAFLVLGVLALFVIACFIPSLAVTVRRFHDAGQSGWLLLLDVFCTGGIVTLIFGCLDGQPGHNKYGPNPKGIGNDW
jgi:uncharacterized membrane protein YhaH (DUF805 family)